MFEKILEQIRCHDTIIIHRHTNPDGDAMGSQIGLKHIIKENFPEKRVLTVGDPAKRFAFMQDSTMDEVAEWARARRRRPCLRWQSCWTPPQRP